MSSRRTDIANALKSRLETITDIKLVNIDDIRLLASDFQEWELPCVQIIDMAEDNAHELGRGLKTWNISLEIVIGPKVNYVPKQTDLWDLQETIESTLFADPKLSINYVTQMTLLGSATDLHILKPLYTARIDIQITYYQILVKPC